MSDVLEQEPVFFFFCVGSAHFLFLASSPSPSLFEVRCSFSTNGSIGKSLLDYTAIELARLWVRVSICCPLPQKNGMETDRDRQTETETDKEGKKG